MDAYWVRYESDGRRDELNVVQSKLAYGYEAEEITPDLFSFQFVSYDKLTFYIRPANGSRKYEVVYKYNGRYMVLSHIYVYALEFGVFPDVKYIEFFGYNPETLEDHYQKINIE